MNVVFLDYDGVVNVPTWIKKGDKWVCQFNFPSDGRVNDEQCVQWVSEFCERFNYSIVVSSTWRQYKNYMECLWNAGLRDGIAILGTTPRIRDRERGVEIGVWLKQHPEVENYLIFDDDDDMTVHMDHLVQCNTFHGFRGDEYQKACELHEKFMRKGERKKWLDFSSLSR